MNSRYNTAMPRRTVDPPSIRAVLELSTVLNGVPEEAKEALASASHLGFADRGEVIWFSGGEVPFFGVVGVGFVKMVKSMASGQELTHEIMGPGQIFGMLGVIDGSGCPLSARAVSPCWYVKVPKREFLPVYSESRVLKDHVVRRLTLRLRKAHELLAQLSAGTVETRIAAILVMLAESYGHLDEGGAVLLEVPLTRQDISEMAGTTVESTIRVMSRWQKAGLVCTKSGQVTLMDVDRLAESAASVA